MKLPIKLLDKKEKAEFYLALVLQNEKATSVIFEKQEETIKFISTDEEPFKETVEEATENEFLDVLDKVITTAETALPESIETHKTLFGLKDNWIEDDKIKKEYREKLRKASDELALEPIGFMAFSESLINLLQKEEGAPLNAILVNVGKKYLSVYWIRGGKILESKTSEVHESAPYTTDTLLKHFQTGGSFPTKIVISNSNEDDLTQEFINHQWSKSLPFLHLPQIVSLPQDAMVKAILLGAATQMNSNLIFDYDKELEEQDLKDGDAPKTETPKTDEKEEVQEEKDEKETDTLIITDHKDTFEVSDEEPKIIAGGTDNALEFFGFVEGADVVKQQPEKIEVEKKIPEEIIEQNFEEIPNEIKQVEEQQIPPAVNAALVTDKIKEVLPKLIGVFKKIKINKDLLNGFKSKNKLILIIPAVLILALVVVLYYYLFKTTVQVNVYVNPKQDQVKQGVTFSSSTDIANKTLAFETVSVSEDGTATTPSTGKDYVGDKAKGSVTIFNNSSSTVSLSSGTKITSSNNLDFTLDSSVSVSSASGDIFTGTKPGTTSVNVTASAIGTDYNLPSGTKFSIGSNTDIAAKNDNAFSGGTKKAVTVVSSGDMNKLLTDLPKSLEQKAQNDLKSKVTDGKTIIAQFISEDISNKSFDKKAGEQASSVSLKGTVDFEAISYSNDDMLSLANSVFPSSEKILQGNFTVDASNIKQQKSGDITADLTFNAKLMPNIDIYSLRKQIAGESKQKAINTLSNLDQAQSVDINFNPSIPLLPQNLPGDYKKIFINITSK